MHIDENSINNIPQEEIDKLPPALQDRVVHITQLNIMSLMVQNLPAPPYADDDISNMADMRHARYKANTKLASDIRPYSPVLADYFEGIVSDFAELDAKAGVSHTPATATATATEAQADEIDPDDILTPLSETPIMLALGIAIPPNGDLHKLFPGLTQAFFNDLVEVVIRHADPEGNNRRAANGEDREGGKNDTVYQACRAAIAATAIIGGFGAPQATQDFSLAQECVHQLTTKIQATYVPKDVALRHMQGDE